MHQTRLLTSLLLLVALLSIGPVGQVIAEPSPEIGTITVHKFHDHNRNGVQDPGDEDVPGWLFRLYTWNGIWDMVAEGVTGPDGTLSFIDMAANRDYRVWEEDRECWEPTTPSDLVYWSHDAHPGYYAMRWLDADQVLTVDFGNVNTCPPPPPTGGEGCTPGYWKNHLDSWQLTPFAPDDLYDTVFGVPYSPTLIMALKTGGGGKKALGRHSVAAILNAAHPDVNYAYTVDEIIAMVQAAYGSGEYEAAKDRLAEQNESGCTVRKIKPPKSLQLKTESQR